MAHKSTRLKRFITIFWRPSSVLRKHAEILLWALKTVRMSQQSISSKAALFYKVGALRGHILSRFCIAEAEYDLGNHETGIRHFKIAAEAGLQPALDILMKIFDANGNWPGKEFISKEELDTLYRACHEAQEDVKSEEREKYSTEEEKRRDWTQC